METASVTIASLVNMYLYGSFTAPESIEDRLRLDSVTNSVAGIDAAAYMRTFGRFASPYQSKAIESFVSGS